MYLLTGTYGEVCAFIDGMDHASGHNLMDEFRSWLIARGVTRPELAWWLLVLNDLFPGESGIDPKRFTKEENEAAIAELFALLESFLEQRSEDKDP
ncbi:hypothetical protein ACIBHX_11565 [Nonomuraea sp. NPDC050536]|uniref:hypothetical protein n=1 Tax=Nonomuraea sp. NPDC050536 TaxID=3364366 RepID=UPI0037C83C87